MKRTIEQIYRKIEQTAAFTGIMIDDPNKKGLFAEYPLHIAAGWGDCEAIRILIENGADIDIRGERDFTPLMEAVSQRKLDAVRLLVELGAKPIVNDDGRKPSELAELIGETEIAEFLKERGF